MRSLIALVFVATALSANAAELVSRKFSFTYFGHDVGSSTYYSCDSAEDMAREQLQTLGAQNIRVSCSGGIQNWGNRWDAFPVSITARFAVPASRENAQRMVIKDSGRDSNCDFNAQFLAQLLKKLPNARLVSRSVSCRGADGRYSFTVDAAL